MDGALTVHVVGLQLCARVPGGTGRYTAELARALPAQARSGDTVGIIATRRCNAADELGMPVSRLPLPIPALARLWDRGLPPAPAVAGVVHAPTLLAPPARRRYRLVVTVHDAVPWTHPHTLTPRGVAFHTRIGRRVAAGADLIVTPTEAVAVALRRILSPTAPVVAVHSGVVAATVPPDAAQRRHALGLDPDGYVLFVGTAEPRKGLATLVSALAQPDLAGRSLVVAGPAGWGDVNINDIVDQAGVAGRVRIVGRVDDLDLAAVYDGASALALPSDAEGFGFPVLEAMGHGVPVVTSADPALVEVGGGVARVVPQPTPETLAVALAEVLEPGEERASRVREGRSRASEFTWERTAEQMWRLYRDVSR